MKFKYTTKVTYPVLGAVTALGVLNDYSEATFTDIREFLEDHVVLTEQGAEEYLEGIPLRLGTYVFKYPNVVEILSVGEVNGIIFGVVYDQLPKTYESSDLYYSLYPQERYNTNLYIYIKYGPKVISEILRGITNEELHIQQEEQVMRDLIKEIKKGFIKD